MANIIKIKRSQVTNTPSALAEGELAYSEASGTLFIGTSGSNVTAIGGTSSLSNSYGTFAVSGQDSVVASSASDTVNLVAGGIVTITTNAGTDTITITATEQYLGTVTSVGAGDGMNFTGFTTSGTITLGTPSTLTASTTNSLTTNSHTHAITGFIPSTYLDTDGTLSADSDTKIATQRAVKAYADNLINAANGMVYKGAIDASETAVETAGAVTLTSTGTLSDGVYDNGGLGYPTTTDGSGLGATVEVTISGTGTVAVFAIINGGTGYVVSDTLVVDEHLDFSDQNTGTLDSDVNTIDFPLYPTADAGHLYRISVDGKIGGAGGTVVQSGDMLICLTDGVSIGDQTSVGANWNIIQANIDGAVIGPASAVNSNVAFFDGTSGKLIKDSGIALTGSNTGDVTIPTPKYFTISGQTITQNTIAAIYGGTGQVGYNIGDILYADSATTLSRLADIATGNVLISGGVGVIPSYGKVGLTTHVSGTLAVGNGGTGATSFTTKGILYGQGTSPVLVTAAGTWDGTAGFESGELLSVNASGIPTWTNTIDGGTFA